MALVKKPAVKKLNTTKKSSFNAIKTGKITKKLKKPIVLIDADSEASTDNDYYKEQLEMEEDVNEQIKKIMHKCKNRKSQLKEHVKAPTLDEINNLKETQNLYHSNLFRLQVEEMLRELQVKQQHKKLLHGWLEMFKSFLRTLESDAEKQAINALCWLNTCQINLPFQLQQFRVIATQEKNVYFQFIKPTVEPYLMGAAACNALLGQQLVADICLTMPAAYFQKNNCINFVYEHKRALYLTYITWQMLKKCIQLNNLTVDQLKFNYYANNPLKPVLLITPNTSSKNKLLIRLFVAAEESVFKMNRFVPWNNNIRETMFMAAETRNEHDNEDAITCATPNYNANVLFDLTMHANQKLLHQTFDKQTNLQEGLLLLRVWLRQRHLNIGISGFHTHLLAMFIVYLRQHSKLHVTMSSYQVARTVWNHLAQSSWELDGKGISLCKQNKNEKANQPTLEQMHTYHSVVFIDITGFYNISANLNLEVYKRVRNEAQLAIELLNDSKVNNFQLLFMKECPPYTQFDHLLKISKPDAVEQLIELHVTPADKCNYAGQTNSLLLKLITELLQKGLKKRVSALLPIEKATESWSVDAVSTPAAPQYLHLGISLNEKHAFEVLDKCSSSNEAEEFRKFWGDKAELRRFQDGTITESVVWASSTNTLREKRLVVRSIVLHLLNLHFQLEPQDVHYIAGELDVVYCLSSAYKLPKLHAKCSLTQETDAETATLPVIHAFDALSRQLTALKDLPLEIVNVAGTSSIFRYCEPTPLLPVARHIGDNFFADIVPRAVIQLGQSGKWPSELGALRALKFAFYLQIAKLLRERCGLQVKVNTNGLLVFKFGYCFGLELAHTKELALLKRETNERGIVQYVHSEASRVLEKRHYILPRVSAALHALYQQQPSFGPTVMIAKRWLYAQLIDPDLWPDEATELLVATLFNNLQADLMACSSPQTGFMRFLQLLARSDWRIEYFLLNFNNATDETPVLEEKFNVERDIYPPLCIGTSFDMEHQGLLWTKHSAPNTNVLARVTLLARKALQIVQETIYSTHLVFIKPAQLFYPSNEGYDLVIQLKSELISTAKVPDFGSPFAALSKPNWRLPLADSSMLADAVDALRQAYSNFAAFFYNPCGGKEIGIVWKPNIFEELKDFKVTEVNGYSLSSTNKIKLQCRKDTLIEDFKFILKDFYLRVGHPKQVLDESKTENQLQRKISARYFTNNSDIVTIKMGKPIQNIVQTHEKKIIKKLSQKNKKNVKSHK